ncbi:uncharacterized protein LOC129601569 [Paramacrobiotus metropolitanus]|uniref:uncharacterized protein LOC129601569 n=1 Tax=Paramacrobiotus metropolitanus TaxID=2943436 RepID=UPI002445ACE2|nr:uncharacterized protein LOC129601569 [Paramacrobiotus metropolitanus]
MDKTGKRKADDASNSTTKSIKSDPGCGAIKPDPGSASVSGDSEQERSAPPQLVTVVTGEFVAYGRWSAVEALALPCHRQNDRFHVNLPAHIDPWAAHLVLQAALHPGLPIDTRHSRNGSGGPAATSQLLAASAFLKIPLPTVLRAANRTPQPRASAAGQDSSASMTVQPRAAVGIPATVASSTTDSAHGQPAITSQSLPPEPVDPPVAEAHLSLGALLELLRQDFIPFSTEMALYQKVMKWFRVDYPARWTRENFEIVLPELRWDLLGDMLPLALLTATGPLRDALLDLQTRLFPPDAVILTAVPRERHFKEVACLFYADRHTASLRVYDARQNTLHRIQLPAELVAWNVVKEMGLLVDNRVLFRVQHRAHLQAYALTLTAKNGADDDAFKAEMECLFKKHLKYAADPLVSLQGRVYGWSTGTMPSPASFAYDPAARGFDNNIHNPKCIRKDAAFDVWNNQYFIILGGYPATGCTRDIVPLASGEMFDAATNDWSELPAMMQQARCSFAAKICNGYLYVTGGCGPSAATGAVAVLGSCERLQLGVAGAQWQRLPDLTIPRYGSCMFVLNDQLHVCGGCYRQGVQLTEWEVYEAASDRWSVVRPVELPGSSGGLCHADCQL